MTNKPWNLFAFDEREKKQQTVVSLCVILHHFECILNIMKAWINDHLVHIREWWNEKEAKKTKKKKKKL